MIFDSQITLCHKMMSVKISSFISNILIFTQRFGTTMVSSSDQMLKRLLQTTCVCHFSLWEKHPHKTMRAKQILLQGVQQIPYTTRLFVRKEKTNASVIHPHQRINKKILVFSPNSILTYKLQPFLLFFLYNSHNMSNKVLSRSFCRHVWALFESRVQILLFAVVFFIFMAEHLIS